MGNGDVGHQEIEQHATLCLPRPLLSTFGDPYYSRASISLVSVSVSASHCLQVRQGRRNPPSRKSAAALIAIPAEDPLLPKVDLKDGTACAYGDDPRVQVREGGKRIVKEGTDPKRKVPTKL